MELPYTGLKVLAEFSRNTSLRRTAIALNVTEGAVSKQLKLLQEQLELALLKKQGSRLVLTPAGEQLAAVSRDSFEQISNAVERLKDSQEQRALRIACVPTFFAHWLLPRTGRLQETSPGINVEYLTHSDVHLMSPQDSNIDALIDVGRLPVDEGLTISPFMDHDSGPVATPDYLEKHMRDDDWSEAVWLCSKTRPTAIKDWFPADTDGIPQPSPEKVTWFDNIFLCLQAARAGQGVTIASACYIQEDLDSARLVTPLGMQKQPIPFYLAWDRQLSGNNPKLQNFLSWLRVEAR